MIHPYTKESVFDHFVAQAGKQLPTGLTHARVMKCRGGLLGSWEYDQELLRHGLKEKSIYKLRDTDSVAYGHLEGNFWHMVLDEYSKMREEGT